MLLLNILRATVQSRNNIKLFMYYNFPNKLLLRSHLFKSFSVNTCNYFLTAHTGDVSKAFLNLDNKCKQRERIYKNQVESVIKYVENEGIGDCDMSLILLKSCGNLILDEIPATRISLAERAWKVFINRKINLNVEHYNTLLKCHIENKVSTSYKNFLKNMNCEPNEQTYRLLLESACENGDMTQAADIVSIMKTKGISGNEFVFSSLILGYLKSGNIKSAQNTLSTMKIIHKTIGTRTYTSLLRGYAESGDVESFTKTLNASPKLEFSSKQVISVLRSIAVSENTEVLPALKKYWSLMIESRIFETEITKLCINLIYNNKAIIAYEIFKAFIEPEVGFTSTTDSYGASLFYEMTRAHTPVDIIIKIADDMIKANRNSLALFKATEAALKIPEVELSLQLLKALRDKKNVLKNHYFWPLLLHEGKSRGEAGIFEIFKAMRDMDLIIETETLKSYSLQFITELDPDVIINQLKQFNLTVTDVLTPLSIVFLRANRLQEVMKLNLKYKVRLDYSKIIKHLSTAFLYTNDVKSTIGLLKFIHSRDKSDDWPGLLILNILIRSEEKANKFIINLLKAYQLNELKISTSLLERIDFHVMKIKDNKTKLNIQNILNSLDYTNGVYTRNNIPHPRNMNLEELECHLIELRNKEMSTRGILRKLIQLHCRTGNIKRVSELCDEFKQLNYTISVGMKASLLDLYVKTGKFENAWHIFNEIKTNNSSFLIDEYKIIDLARLLLLNNKFDNAINILKEESSRRNIKGTNLIEHNCCNLLNTIAETGNVDETRMMFKTLISCGYCSHTDNILQSLISVHLVKNKLNEAVEEYVNICANSNKTPFVYELLCSLIKEETATELVERVVDVTAKIKGVNSAKMILAIALAETGQIKALRKLIAESNVHLSSVFLEPYCHRWVMENKSATIKNLLTAAKDLNKIDTTLLYLSVMKIYSSTSDCESALALWAEAQDDILHSREVKTTLINLLNNVKHPMAEKIS